MKEATTKEEVEMTTEECTIKGEHCSQCGSIDLEDLGYGNDSYDGYTFCCNEPTTDGPCDYEHN